MARTRILLVSGLMVAAWTLDGHQAAAQVGTQGNFSATRAVINNCSITTSFVTIPGMTRPFTLGGTTNDEVVVMFQASWSGTAMTFDTAFVRLTIDGVVQPVNTSVPIFAGSDGNYTHGFTWITQSLAPGPHTARVQWRTDLGSTLCVDDRTMVVLHR